METASAKLQLGKKEAEKSQEEDTYDMRERDDPTQKDSVSPSATRPNEISGHHRLAVPWTQRVGATEQ